MYLFLVGAVVYSVYNFADYLVVVWLLGAKAYVLSDQKILSKIFKFSSKTCNVRNSLVCRAWRYEATMAVWRDVGFPVFRSLVPSTIEPGNRIVCIYILYGRKIVL